jgi:hypothetical protein
MDISTKYKYSEFSLEGHYSSGDMVLPIPLSLYGRGSFNLLHQHVFAHLDRDTLVCYIVDEIQVATFWLRRFPEDNQVDRTPGQS